MNRIDELYSLFLRNFPYITREEATARSILSNPENHIIERRDENGALYAASVVNQSAILLLCVDEPHRRKGVGSALLAESEQHIRANGHSSVTIGVGFDYLCPGVPVREKPFPENLLREDVDPRIPENNAAFFIRRGYAHSWNDCNCFDMRQPMSACNLIENEPGDTIRGVTYRWATPEDLPAILRCTDDAEQGFTKYYASGDFYREDAPQRTLIALADGIVVGTLIVSRETESPGLGSIGCTAVMNAYQGRHIASNMIMLGAKSLHAAGMKEGYLGYTYSGLDRLYGRAGYAVSTLYFMAEKDLSAPDITLRDRTEAHVERYFSAVQDPEIKSRLPMKAQTLAEALVDFRATLQPGATSFGQTIYLGDAYIGDIWCHSIDSDGDPQAMLSYCIFDKSFWNRGIATRALCLFLNLVKSRFGIKKFGAFAYLSNTASIRVLEKNGFSIADHPDENSAYYTQA